MSEKPDRSELKDALQAYADASLGDSKRDPLFTGPNAFDHLCDRCCKVLVREHPDHWSVLGIKAAALAQKKMLMI